jgi:hypothetical protein
MPPHLSSEPKFFSVKRKHSKRQSEAKIESEPEIEWPYSREVWSKAKKPAPLSKQWSIKEKEAILDYLHGYVADDEVKACCYYEYARASEPLRRARREFNQNDPRTSSVTISNYFPRWILNADRFCFLQCKNFPRSAWRDLTRKSKQTSGHCSRRLASGR